MAVCGGCTIDYFAFIARFFENADNARDFLRHHRALPQAVKCPTCHTQCSLSSELVWSCTETNPCGFAVSDLKGTFLDNYDLPPWKIVLFVNHWLSKHWDQETVAKCIDISKTTYVEWRSLCTEVTDFWFGDPESIGGDGIIVEIDETLIVRREHEKGSVLSQVWVFGGIERVTKKKVVVPLIGPVGEERDTGTLLPIIKKYICPGSVIISDQWGAIHKLSEHGFEHYMINHSENSVNSKQFKVHTQNIKGLWRDLNEWVKRPDVKSSFLHQYLARYLFIKVHGELSLHFFFIYAGRLYPGDGNQCQISSPIEEEQNDLVHPYKGRSRSSESQSNSTENTDLSQDISSQYNLRSSSVQLSKTTLVQNCSHPSCSNVQSPTGELDCHIKKANRTTATLDACDDLPLDGTSQEDFVDTQIRDDIDDHLPSGKGGSTPLEPKGQPEKEKKRKGKKERDLQPLPQKKAKVSRQMNEPPIQDYRHPAPEFLRSPFEYFQDMFTTNLLDHIVCQANLFAQQSNVNTTFRTDKREVIAFFGILMYMGVCRLPSIEYYWATDTRVPQVANVMSCKRFKLLGALLPFSNNENGHSSTDKFYKIRPLYSAITKRFLQVSATVIQSVDKVMIPYEGTEATDLPLYSQGESDKLGFKLFCRASEDGFIHDILLYQGDTTFSSHPTPLSEEESAMTANNKIMISLLKTVQNPKQTIIDKDHIFSGTELAECIKKQYCCTFPGRERENGRRIGTLMSVEKIDTNLASMETNDSLSSSEASALHGENKIDAAPSSNGRKKPMSDVLKDDSNSNTMANRRRDETDKGDLQIHCNKALVKGTNWAMTLFAYALDVCISNAWLLYKRDCLSLDEEPKSLKNFQLNISTSARSQLTVSSFSTKQSMENKSMLMPRANQDAEIPRRVDGFDASKLHMPIFTVHRKHCKNCSMKDDIHRTRWMCCACKAPLCLSDARNCFTPFHQDATRGNLEEENVECRMPAQQVQQHKAAHTRLTVKTTESGFTRSEADKASVNKTSSSSSYTRTETGRKSKRSSGRLQADADEQPLLEDGQSDSDTEDQDLQDPLDIKPDVQSLFPVDPLRISSHHSPRPRPLASPHAPESSSNPPPGPSSLFPTQPSLFPFISVECKEEPDISIVKHEVL